MHHPCSGSGIKQRGELSKQAGRGKHDCIGVGNGGIETLGIGGSEAPGGKQTATGAHSLGDPSEYRKGQGITL